MKTVIIFLFAIVVVLSSQLFAQEEDTAAAEPGTIAWYLNYNEALNAASAEDRYMLIEFYTDW
ncbi:MAG TPA: hypothetical protein ENO22_00630 [candidate division Zixibacteria bacterium]|nr:hypothetical protein [candidate division Zixibacteria bacterium]